MITRIAALVLLLISGQALGHVPSMKSDNFEVLSVGTTVIDCPFTEAEVDAIWESELLRARLSGNGLGLSNGALWFSADCLKRGELDSWVYEVEVNWTWTEEKPAGIEYSGNSPRSANIYPEVTVSSTYGLGDKSFILEAAREIIQKAITRYLKANLD